MKIARKPRMKRVNERIHNGELIWDEVPERPFVDWQARALKVADTGLFVVVALAMVGSAWAIGHLLTLIGWPVWVAYGLAVIADAFWGLCHVKAWGLRYDEEASAPARHAGKIMLIGSIAANAAHALVLLAGGLPTWQLAIAVAITAGLPVAGKVAMRLTMPDHPVALTDDDRKALAKKRARIHSDIATAEMRVDLMRAERKLARLTGTEYIAQPEPAWQDSKPGHQDTALDTPGQAVPIASDTPGHQVAAPALTGQDTAGTAPRDDRPLSEVVRDTIKQGVPVSDLVSRVCQLRPDTKRDTIKRTVNRELSKIEQGGGYL